MARFKYVAELVKKKKEKSDAPAEGTDCPTESKSEQEASTTGASTTGGLDDSSTAKDSIERKNSSSSNKSNSDSDWCIVEPTEQ